jgi:light-regulated signal transduction histidine kinase (bacteriophytochrome)
MFLALATLIPVFLLDLFLTPLGYAEWLLYLFPLLLGYYAEKPRFSLALLGLVGILLAIGFAQSHGTAPAVVSLINRLEGYSAFIVFTLIVNRLIVTKAALSESKYNVIRRNNDLSEAYRQMESFAYSLSHDLRAPLQSVLGFTEMLREDYGEQLDQDGLKYLEWIRNSASAMNALIDDMLELAALSHQELHREQVNLSACAENIIADLRRSNPDRRVRCVIAANLTACADQRLIAIALTNLLGNAWKYTQKTDRPRIEFGATSQNGQTAYFVRDNGAGFDMRFAERLFEPFRRLHSDKEYAGTGIGLATVDRVIRRHGGAIRAEASPGKGATFYFTLPPC